MQYFNYSEFDSPDKPGSGKNMQDITLKKLDRARERAGIPFYITSGYRTPAHNQVVGGASNSAHLRGYAVDIAVKGSRERYLIIEALINEGFHRIGIGEKFVHADNDPGLDPRVIWDYYKDQKD